MSVKRIPSSLLFVIVAVVGIVAIVYFVRQTTIVLDAPQPHIISGSVDSLPQMPFSIVEAPVTYDLDTAIDSLEVAVPRTYGDLDQKIVTAKNERVSFSFLLHRSPFRVTVRGQSVTISADVEYSGRVWYRPPI